MSDDSNIVDFTKRLGANNSNNAKSIEERIVNCASQRDCSCMYCNYNKDAAEIIVEVLSRDINECEDETGAKVCTYDLKSALFAAINLVKALEKDELLD